MRRRSVIVAATLAVVALLAMGTAEAQVPTTIITGGGTNITAIAVGNDLSYQVMGFGETDAQFYPPDTCLNLSNCAGGQPGDVGFLVEIAGTVYGPDFANHGEGSAADFYTPYTPVSHSAVTGTGTSSDPYRVTTTVGAGPLQITQVVLFVEGSYSARFDYTLSNPTGAPVPVRAWAIGDLYLQGSDAGVGFRDAPSGAVGGANATGDFFVVIAPRVPAPSHYDEDDYPDLWTKATNLQDLEDLVCLPTVAPPYDLNGDPCYDDNMAGLQWDVTVPAGGSFLISHYWSFGALPEGIVDCAAPFTDIASSFAFDEICTLFTRNVTAGTSATTYGPGQNVTREQMAVFMLRVWEWYFAKPYDGAVMSGVFTDIAGSFAETQIEQLAGLGVTAGCSLVPARYCPGNPVTRAEMAVFMMRLYESILGLYTGPTGGAAFTDIAGSFAETQIEQLVGLGISSGTSPTTYSPNAPVTREQMAIFLIRLMERLLAG